MIWCVAVSRPCSWPRAMAATKSPRCWRRPEPVSPAPNSPISSPFALGGWLPGVSLRTQSVRSQP
jgi:hypothetical protein